MLDLKGRDFIDLRKFTKDELEGLITLAEDIKSGKDSKKHLQDKNLGLLFGVSSTSTRLSF